MLFVMAMCVNAVPTVAFSLLRRSSCGQNPPKTSSIRSRIRSNIRSRVRSGIRETGTGRNPSTQVRIQIRLVRNRFYIWNQNRINTPTV